MTIKVTESKIEEIENKIDTIMKEIISPIEVADITILGRKIKLYYNENLSDDNLYRLGDGPTFSGSAVISFEGYLNHIDFIKDNLRKITIKA